jgi:SAM-dependent methyltransferase
MESVNEYSSQWFDLFLNAGDPPRTGQEVAYLARMLPLPEFRRVLDVCCGTGRHARGLGQLGYEATGVDRDEQALHQARLAGIPGTAFLQRDMRELRSLQGTWDAAVIMWASFGYFEPEVNRSVLRDLIELLRPGGRIILDMYNRSHFEVQPERRVLNASGREVQEVRRLRDGRLDVELKYLPEGGGDHFSWEIFGPSDLAQLGRECGLELAHVCSGFDETAAPTASLPRMQALFIR